VADKALSTLCFCLFVRWLGAFIKKKRFIVSNWGDYAVGSCLLFEGGIEGKWQSVERFEWSSRPDWLQQFLATVHLQNSFSLLFTSKPIQASNPDQFHWTFHQLDLNSLTYSVFAQQKQQQTPYKKLCFLWNLFLSAHRWSNSRLIVRRGMYKLHLRFFAARPTESSTICMLSMLDQKKNPRKESLAQF
jgi:hypothetical protein